MNAPAFPVSLDTVHDKHGLSTREYFAAAALAGFLANPDLAGPHKELDSPARLAHACVGAADALVAALAESPSGVR